MPRAGAGTSTNDLQRQPGMKDNSQMTVPHAYQLQRITGLGQTSIKLRSSVGPDVELRTRRTNQMNPTKKQFWPASVRSVINFLSNEAKYTLLYKFLIHQSSSSNVKFDVCPGDDLQTFYTSEADG